MVKPWFRKGYSLIKSLHMVWSVVSLKSVSSENRTTTDSIMRKKRVDLKTNNEGRASVSGRTKSKRGLTQLHLKTGLSALGRRKGRGRVGGRQGKKACVHFIVLHVTSTVGVCVNCRKFIQTAFTSKNSV